MSYKDRSGGLVAFGVMTLLLGMLAGLLVPLMFVAQVIAAKANHTPADFSLNRMIWLMSLSVLPFLGYLLFIRRFLLPKS